MNGEQIKEIMIRIAAVYPQFDLTGEVGNKRIEVWSSHLKDMPYDQVSKRLDDHIAVKSFPPAISEIAVKPKKNNDFLELQKEWENNAKHSKHRR